MESSTSRRRRDSRHSYPLGFLMALLLGLPSLLLGLPPSLHAQPGNASLAAPDATSLPSPGEPVCRLDTNLGTMVFRFFRTDAPGTVAHFEKLVRAGFYDGQRFYRVVAGHVIQAGDGGENDWPKVNAEFNQRPHLKGTVGLARSEDPNSGGTEFYICHAPRPHLDGRYTVFGQLVAGVDVLDTIAASAVTEKWVGDGGKVAFHEPKQAVLIHRASIVPWSGPVAVSPPSTQPATQPSTQPPATQPATQPSPQPTAR